MTRHPVDVFDPSNPYDMTAEEIATTVLPTEIEDDE